MDSNMVSGFRGFNLLSMFCSENSPINRGRAPGYFSEEDFKMISELGFNFVRIPLSYRVWGDVNDLYYIDENKLSKLDDAVEYADKYGLHINIAMHRAPGYCVNTDEQEKLDLWNDQEALDAFKYHFHKIAERYTKVSVDKLSYNVVNEPDAKIPLPAYTDVCLDIISEVRSIDPDRYFMVDGPYWGQYPQLELLTTREKNIIYSGRGYEPRVLTHHNAEWSDDPRLRKMPVWPEKNYYDVSRGRIFGYGTEELKQDVDYWGAMRKIYDVPVIFGEMGVYNKTPHDVALRWLDDLIKHLKENKIGWAMWNFIGKFGIINSERADVKYEDFHGYKLDRKMLDILLKY